MEYLETTGAGKKYQKWKKHTPNTVTNGVWYTNTTIYPQVIKLIGSRYTGGGYASYPGGKIKDPETNTEFLQARLYNLDHQSCYATMICPPGWMWCYSADSYSPGSVEATILSR